MLRDASERYVIEIERPLLVLDSVIAGICLQVQVVAIGDPIRDLIGDTNPKRQRGNTLFCLADASGWCHLHLEVHRSTQAARKAPPAW